MSDPLLDKADALMQRHTPDTDHHMAPVAEALLDIDEEIVDVNTDADDVPLLTDVVDHPAMHSEMADAPTGLTTPASFPEEETSRQESPALNADQQTRLAHELESWLDEQMPQLVIRLMDGMTDQLVAQLTQHTRDELLPRLKSVLLEQSRQDQTASHNSE